MAQWTMSISSVIYMLAFFTNLSLMEFQIRFLALFCLFSVIDSYQWFWMGSYHNNILLMLEFLRTPLLVLHVFYYKLMTFLMMLNIILLSMLMIVWSCIWSVATTRVGFCTWIWSTRHFGLGMEVGCWFQYWKNSTCFVWPV